VCFTANVNGTPRTQAERSASTRTALLDAAIETLIDSGYASLTTRRVGERAGLSQGAQQHHFRSKADLVAAAIGRLFEHVVAAALSSPIEADTERGRAEALLDRVWEVDDHPIAHAVIDVLVAARTDDALARTVRPVVKAAFDGATAGAAQLLPTYAALPDFPHFITTAIATARGLVVVKSIPGCSDLQPDWPIVRAQMMSTIDALAEDHNKSNSTSMGR